MSAEVRLAAVKHLIRQMNNRFGYYTSPRSGRTLTQALRREFNNMASLFSDAYAAIQAQEKEVDGQVADLTQQVLELQAKVASAGTPTPTPTTPVASVPHDGGYIFSTKGRKIGSSDDRATLDTIIDRVSPEAPADPAFVPSK